MYRLRITMLSSIALLAGLFSNAKIISDLQEDLAQASLTLDFGEQKSLESNSIYYANEGTTVTFDILLTCNDSIAKVIDSSKCILHVNKNDKEIATLETPHAIKISEEDSTQWCFSTTYSIATAGDYLVGGEVLFFHINNNNDTTSVDTITLEVQHINALREIAAVPSRDEYFVIVNENVILEPIVCGGYGSPQNEGDWKFEWKSGSTTVKPESEGIYSYQLTATNYINGVEWDSKDVSFTVIACKKPELIIGWSNINGLHNVGKYIEKGDISVSLVFSSQSNMNHLLDGRFTLYERKDDATLEDVVSKELSSTTNITQTRTLKNGNNIYKGECAYNLTQETRTSATINDVTGQLEFATRLDTIKTETIWTDEISLFVLEDISITLTKKGVEKDKRRFYARINHDFEVSANITGGYGNVSNDWTFEWDSEKGESNKSFKENRIGNKNYRLKATNYIGDDIWFSKDIDFTIEWVGEPAISISQPTDTTICYPNKPNFEVEYTGGYAPGWTLAWQRDGTPISGGTSTIPYNETDRKVNVTYTVTVTNKDDDGIEWFNEQRSVSVHQYASPQVIKVPEGERYLFVGDKYNFKDSIQYKNGYEEGWTVNVYNETDQVELESFVATAQAEDKTYKTTISNAFEHSNGTKSIWFEKNYYVTIRGLKEAQISEIMADSIDIYAGSHVKLSLTHEGGIPDRWTFSWKDISPVNPIEGVYNTFKEAPEWDYYYYYSLEGDNYSGRNIEVWGVSWTDGRRDSLYSRIDLRIWPTIDFGDIAENTNMVREGNVTSLSLERPHGGFADGWKYRWHEASKNTVLSESLMMSTIPTITFNSKGQEKKRVSYVVEATNFGPSGNIWGGKSFDNKSVVVYHRPETPVKLKRKGNGSSHTMVVDNNNWMSEEELTNYNYKFWFGYTNSLGEDIAIGSPTTNRYFTFDNENLYWQEDQYWVCAVWDYDDGARITSGKCYMKGGKNVFEGTSKDEMFDKSDFSRVSRAGGEMSGVEKLPCVESPSRAYIYQADGKLVRQCITSEGKHIDTKGLKNGMYVVKYVQGNNMTIKKIFIK